MTDPTQLPDDDLLVVIDDTQEDVVVDDEDVAVMPEATQPEDEVEA